MSFEGIKIMIADDDPFFRDVLKKCLEDEGAEILAVESIDFAKKGIPFFGPELILSDVQMPGGTGIDLLSWARETSLKTPIVIMTGFSELADAASAANAGAAGFLAKPFKQDDLKALLHQVREANGTGGKPESADREFDFLKVSVEDLIVGSQIQVPIYLRLPSGKGFRFVKIAHHGEDLSVDRVRTYKEKGVHHLYLAREDYLRYVGMSVKVAKAASRLQGITDEKRARLVRNTLEVVEQQIHCGDISSELYEHAKTLVEVSVSALSGTDAGFFVLESVREISDEIYAHSAAVSMVACMIGKAIGWTSPRTLSKVSMAGMLHDVGKRQIPRALAVKPKAQMDAAELAIYETHPARGVLILSELDFIPGDVIQAVNHHHERGNGFGFPGRLTEDKIFPLAKVIAVADEFCGLYLRDEEARASKDPRRALERLMEYHAEGLATEPLIALHQAFGVTPPEALLKKKKKAA